MISLCALGDAILTLPWVLQVSCRDTTSRNRKGKKRRRRGEARQGDSNTMPDETVSSYLRTHCSLHQPFTHSLPPIRMNRQVAETCSPSPPLRCASFQFLPAVAGFDCLPSTNVRSMWRF
ncbi:hypothetical protein HDV57DRAFT_489395 [Trichoderma longibrachiatum]